MSTAAIPLSQRATSRGWQNDFVNLLPQIKTHAGIRFRRLLPVDREEAVAEALAAACLNYRRLVEGRYLHRAYVTSVADFAVRHVHQDRHVGGAMCTTDVLSRKAQTRHGFRVKSLAAPADGGWKDLAVEDRRTGPAEIAALRVDFQEWLRGFSRRDRKIINLLAARHRTSDVARRIGVSEARVSQKRREFETSWDGFQKAG